MLSTMVPVILTLPLACYALTLCIADKAVAGAGFVVRFPSAAACKLQQVRKRTLNGKSFPFFILMLIFIFVVILILNRYFVTHGEILFTPSDFII